MVEPRSEPGAGGVALHAPRVDLVATELGVVLVRVSGRWEGPAFEGVPVLRLAGRAFPALTETSGAALRLAPDPGAFRATFSVPEELRRPLQEELVLEAAGREFTLPPAGAAVAEGRAVAPSPLPRGGPVGGNVVDREVLAERRARRAEL